MKPASFSESSVQSPSDTTTAVIKGPLLPRQGHRFKNSHVYENSSFHHHPTPFPKADGETAEQNGNKYFEETYFYVNKLFKQNNISDVSFHHTNYFTGVTALFYIPNVEMFKNIF
jgi:hypothetical protein